MEIFLEILFEFFFEVVIQIGFEILVELGLHSRAKATRKRKERNPIWVIIGYAVLGIGVGAVSLLIFPQSLLPISKMYQIIGLIITPLLGGLAMSAIGWIRRRKGESLIRLDSFAYGFIFALGMTFIRFLFAK